MAIAHISAIKSLFNKIKRGFQHLIRHVAEFISVIIPEKALIQSIPLLLEVKLEESV